ncbi:MAG: UPF0182 family protein [Acidobacteria bacterium]|nr:UPF0182 family protein [Acidobacteriota bacterium]
MTSCLWIWAVYAWLILAAFPPLIVDYWFFESLDKADIFWINLRAQLALFSAGLLLFTLAVSIPIRHYARSRTLRKAGLHVGLWVGLFAGWLISGYYLDFLLAVNGGSFDAVDPVFGNDTGLYVFSLPAMWIILRTLTILAITGSLASLVARYDQLGSTGVLERSDISLGSRLGLMITNGLNICLLLFGASLVSQTFLGQYNLLFKDNESSGVRMGAEYLDVNGVFSNLNMIYLSTFVELGLMAVVGFSLYRIGSHYKVSEPVADSDQGPAMNSLVLRVPVKIGIGLLALDLAFFLGVRIKDHVYVAPNEPTIQIPYIQRHIDETLRGYRLENMRTVDWRPPEKPLSAAELMASKTVRNAPILPTWVSYLEEPPDIQHYERVQAGDTTLVYGPILQIYEQEQQLRPYYKFLSVDGVRYNVNGQKRMYVSAVRELPSLAFVGPQEWLRYWGSAALMFTHGFGLVMSPVNEITEAGSPVYAIKDIPPTTSDPSFEVEPRIYIGEGTKDDYILTNVRHLMEFDHATNQSRQEFVYPAIVPGGIRVDSILKRLVLALHTKDITAFLFSQFIDHEKTRVHIYRTPMSRVRRIAPFLFLDSNIYAFIADKRIQWMINGLTTTSNHPYSFREILGDKAEERAVERFPQRLINYAEDSLKITVDAYSGEIHFYQIADDPIVKAWSEVYPNLFEPTSVMPKSIEAQFTYPLQWFHIQFDDIYKRYHMEDPIDFYNVEDLWDDADEVIGSIGRGLSEFGTTDEMTFSYEGFNLLLDPADLPSGSGISSADDDLQFTRLMPFTPEGARNLRSLVLAFQDPGRYGQLLNLRVPPGVFIPGPEQADALIDNDSQVNQQITLWVRHGSQVVRGHTLLLPVGGGLLYIEPLWIVSLQNQLPQIKLFSVVYRGRTTMSTSLDDALRLLDFPEAAEQKANQLPWFEEAESQLRQPGWIEETME